MQRKPTLIKPRKPTKRWRCRDGACGGTHRYLPADATCQKCNRKGMLRPATGLLETIAVSIHGPVEDAEQPAQLELFAD